MIIDTKTAKLPSAAEEFVLGGSLSMRAVFGGAFPSACGVSTVAIADELERQALTTTDWSMRRLLREGACQMIERAFSAVPVPAPPVIEEISPKG